MHEHLPLASGWNLFKSGNNLPPISVFVIICHRVWIRRVNIKNNNNKMVVLYTACTHVIQHNDYWQWDIIKMIHWNVNNHLLEGKRLRCRLHWTDQLLDARYWWNENSQTPFMFNRNGRQLPLQCCFIGLYQRNDMTISYY